MKSKAVFLDRDGTMARDVHYCRRPEDFELFPGVPEVVKGLNEGSYKVVVVTNQSVMKEPAGYPPASWREESGFRRKAKNPENHCLSK